MEIKVLGCSGAEFPGDRPPSFLLNDKILFDTGSLTCFLDIEGQWRIKHIFITIELKSGDSVRIDDYRITP